MKIKARLATSDFSYLEVDFDSKEEFEANYAGLKILTLQDKEKSAVPFSNTPRPQVASKAQQNKIVGEQCPQCLLGKYVLSKAGKVYCNELCWKK